MTMSERPRQSHSAAFRIDGQRHLVTKARLTRIVSNSVRPGTVLERWDDGTLLIPRGDGPLEILQWTTNEAGAKINVPGQVTDFVSAKPVLAMNRTGKRADV